jgi:protein-L-isoaspartate(D-aspartate) O-methyltransferase
MSDDFEHARERMVEMQLIARGIHDPKVLGAMRRVPRERFTPPELRDSAYGDHPLPIGHDQTISQPYIVAFMTEALELTGVEKVLEIGTGSGYQAAVLAEIAREVYTVERIAALSERAREVLLELGYGNIFFKIQNGTRGWPEYAPYDAILVTAAAPEVPEPFLEQLRDGGRLVIPVGDRFSQNLIKTTKTGDRAIREDLGGVRFVSLLGEHGWREEDQ